MISPEVRGQAISDFLKGSEMVVDFWKYMTRRDE